MDFLNDSNQYSPYASIRLTKDKSGDGLEAPDGTGLLTPSTSVYGLLPETEQSPTRSRSLTRVKRCRQETTIWRSLFSFNEGACETLGSAETPYTITLIACPKQAGYT